MTERIGGMVEVDKEVETFISHLRSADTSERTPTSYEVSLRIFRRFLKEDKDVKDVKRTDLIEFFEWLSKPSDERLRKVAYKRSSLMSVRAALTAFFQYMIDTERLTVSPMPKIARQPRPPRNPIYLTEDEKDRLLDVAKYARDKLIVNILVSTGMRLHELLGIRVKDVDFQTNHIKVKLKHGAVRDYIIIPTLVKDDVPRIIERHIMTDMLDDDDVLINLTPRAVQHRLKRLAKAANIKKPLSPHHLRHTFAVLLRSRGIRTTDLKNLLHHKDQATTAIYEDVLPKETEDELRRLKLIEPPEEIAGRPRLADVVKRRLEAVK